MTAALHAVLLSIVFEMPWLPFRHHPPPEQYEDEDDIDEFVEDASLSDEELSVEANVIGSDVLYDKKRVEEDAVNMEDVTGFMNIELEEVDRNADLDHVAALLGRLLKVEIDAK